MAAGTESHMTSSQPVSAASHRGAPVSNDLHGAISPPSKRELASWWKKFSRKTEKDEEKAITPPGIFGVPLADSIRYANVAISLTNEQGESFIYGYVPIVVAKCGVFLKEKATDVEGIFRLSGSAKRIKDLQGVFNSPDRYGKGLDWTGYTVHDAANILRRYLNQLPEPIVPLEFYERFRDPLRVYQAQLGNDPDEQLLNNAEHAKAVTAYQKLITELPPLNRQLLLYILDLLAVFASKSDMNRMTAANLAAIFQPGIISHPSHDMAPQEYRLSQDVLIFLIENQDNFLIGMTGTAVDEQTQKDVESGAPSVKTPRSTIGRSASNASAGADSLRRHGVRRNLSASSHQSRGAGSPNVSTPGTPSSPSAFASGSGGGSLGRSNTVPSKRSPAIGSHRFQRPSDASQASTPTINAPETIPGSPPEDGPKTPRAVAENTNHISQNVVSDSSPIEPPVVAAGVQGLRSSQDPAVPQNIQVNTNIPPTSRDRKISNLFARSPVFGPSDSQGNQQQRQPRKLQKKQRTPGGLNESAQSSQASFHADDGSFYTPAMSPNVASHDLPDPVANAALPPANNIATPGTEHLNDTKQTPSPATRETRSQSKGLMPPKSPTPSIHSRGSATETSDLDILDDPAVREEKRRHRWRPSFAKKLDDSPLAPPPMIGSMPGARSSNSSLGSSRPRKSLTGESHLTQQMGTETSSTNQLSVAGTSSHETGDPPKDPGTDSEKKGFFGKWKAKVSMSKEERRERDAEKERAKSPQRISVDQNASKGSLSALAHEAFPPRAGSLDKTREETPASGAEQQKAETSTAPDPTTVPTSEPEK